MKIYIIEQAGCEKEIKIYCDQVDDEVLAILAQLKRQEQRLVVFDQQHTKQMLEPYTILYCEYVDRLVFIYTKDKIFTTSASLAELETSLEPLGFIRGSKSVLVNVNEIDALQSELGGRIRATLSNQEIIQISRHYAKRLRQLLLK